MARGIQSIQTRIHGWSSHTQTIQPKVKPHIKANKANNHKDQQEAQQMQPQEAQ
jgi:hypothetical protein